jgi:hypothetical protein
VLAARVTRDSTKRLGRPLLLRCQEAFLAAGFGS